MVELLLEQEDIDVNSVDKYGHALLLWATEKGYKVVMKLLMAQGGIAVKV